MYKREKTKKENRNRENQHVKNPSFSSTLLDEIYRSIDKKSKSEMEDPRDPLKRRSDHLLDKIREDRFFKSTSSSSDSFSSVFSSSDTELLYGKKNSRTEHALFFKNRACHSYGDSRDSSPTYRISRQEETLTKSKTNKKFKMPVSPGGRFLSFINSLFNNSKKSAVRNPWSSRRSCDEGRQAFRINQDGFVRKSQDNVSMCSSAPSVTGFCLSKNSEISRDRVKKSVTFCPITVAADEESREDKGNRSMSLYRKNVEEIDHFKIRRSVEEKAREILRGYDRKGKINEDHTDDDDDEDNDDDACSDSSSDLFELDLVINNRYTEELPVYETTCAALIM